MKYLIAILVLLGIVAVGLSDGVEDASELFEDYEL